MEKILDLVQEFTRQAHGDQRRKYPPEPYILHTIRVMEICRRYHHSLPVLSAALLHDVLEDTSVTAGRLEHFLLSVMNRESALFTTRLVVQLTDRYVKAAYPRWNRRKRKIKEAQRIKNTSPEAQTVKYADIMDNCRDLVLYDADFAAVFLRECRHLLAVMDKGHPELRQAAMEMVDTQLRILNGNTPEKTILH